MKKLYSGKQLNNPSMLTTLREFKYREALTPSMASRLHQLELQDQALKQLLSLINNHSENNWLVLTDLSFNLATHQRCDIVLITQAGVYFIQNNLTGNESFVETITTAHNIYFHYENTLKEFSPDLPLHGLIVSEEKSALHALSESIKVLDFTEFETLIEELAQQEVNALAPFDETNEIAERLLAHDAYRVPDPFHFDRPSFDRVKKGMKCAECQSYDLKRKNDAFVCACGYEEPCNLTILRTMNEYHLLFGKRNKKIDAVYAFMNGDIPRNYIEEILEKEILTTFCKVS